jgi:hypothetical protein
VNWELVCAECAKGEEEKLIGVFRMMPYDCVCCGQALPANAQGRPDGAPMNEAAVNRLRAARGLAPVKL